MGLSLRNKILALCVSFVVPTTYLMYTSVNAFEKDISFAQWEKYGNEMLRPLVGLIDSLATHKIGVLKQQQGLPGVNEDFSTATTEAKKQIESLEKEQAAVGEFLQFTPDGLKQRKREESNTENVKKQFLSILETNPTSFVSDKPVHQDLMTHLRTMIAHAGDTSNLILDPDLDSYYLMDIVLLALPQTIDRIQQIEADVSTMIASGTLTAENRTQLGVYAAMLQEADMDRVAADYQSVMNEDANFYGTNKNIQNNLTKRHEDYQAVIKPFIAQLKTLASSESLSLHLEDFHKMAIEARKGSVNFWNFSADVLDELLDTRIADYQSKQHNSMLISVAALIALFIGGWIFAKLLADRISKLASALEERANEMSSTSNTLNDASIKISEGATEQAAAIQETAASLEEMTAMISKNTENTGQSIHTSEKSRSVVEEGKSAVSKMIEAVQSIRDSNSTISTQVNESNQRLSEVTNVINQIAEKTKVINDIVFQTKLLSFNASVEAARAGEHGKGFAVVAEEVGNLATMSGNAAKEIQDMLDKSVSKVNEIISESGRKIETIMRESEEKVVYGQKTSEQCGLVLEEILRTVAEVDLLIREISTASNEQSQGVSEINKAMGELDATTQTNASVASSASLTATEISKQSESLQSIVNELNLVLSGKERAA